MLSTRLWYKVMINPNTLAVLSPKDSPEVSATRPQINTFAWLDFHYVRRDRKNLL